MNLIASSAALRVARCTVGRHKCFIDLGCVASIQQSNVVAQLPTADQPVGRLDTAQGPIPVYSLSRLLSGENGLLRCLTATPSACASDEIGTDLASHDTAPADVHGVKQSMTSARAYCLIIQGAGKRWGLMVDQIQQSTELPHRNLMPLPRDMHADWCLGAALPNDPGSDTDTEASQLLLVINPTAIDGQVPLTFGIRSHFHQNVGGSWNASDSGEYGYESDPLTNVVSLQSATSIRQLVLFDLAQTNVTTERTCLALNAAQVQEITGPQPIASLPHAPTGVLGLIAWRGRALPLLNLSITLGLPDHVAARLTRVVIVRRPLSNDYIAFVAPSTIRTKLLGQNQTARRHDLNLDESLFCGAFTSGKETLLVPDLDHVFAHCGSSIAV